MRKQPIYYLLLFAVASFSLKAQTYPDHFGTGNDIGMTVTSSPHQGLDSIALTLNGTGHLPDMEGASRFLAQAGFGGSYEDMEYVNEIGVDEWLEEQFEMPVGPFLPNYESVYQDIKWLIQSEHPNAEIDRSREFADFIFWTKVFRSQDVLRNKAAFALHQIFVASTRTAKLSTRGYGASDYYDILYEQAFGNFRDILNDVALHPLMGFYLSHFQNKKGDPALGTLPDENFAREIMQLFTIGLWELNNNGTLLLDSLGEPISTYDITDVQELAKVFTGLSGGAWDLEAYPGMTGDPMTFNHNFNRYDLTVPMIMWEDLHEPGPKVMIDGSVIPAGQPGMQDIQDALDVLFHHPNVGPFISYRLIQQLVKSNPSPSYLNRVATVFNNNDQGVRGDMKAVFKAILTDPEARNCEWINHPKTGKLRQPLERIATLLRAFDVDTPSGRLWFSDYSNLFDRIEQIYQGSPTVFNFFSPTYAESEQVAPNDMVSPEFQILHPVTAIHYINFIENAIRIRPFKNFTEVNPGTPKLKGNDDDEPFLDLLDEKATLNADGVNALLDRLDLILCQGQLSNEAKSIMSNSLTLMIDTGNYSSEEVVKIALYYIMSTADFTILK